VKAADVQVLNSLLVFGHQSKQTFGLKGLGYKSKSKMSVGFGILCLNIALAVILIAISTSVGMDKMNIFFLDGSNTFTVFFVNILILLLSDQN
jgi:hypothetical protein